MRLGVGGGSVGGDDVGTGCGCAVELGERKQACTGDDAGRDRRSLAPRQKTVENNPLLTLEQEDGIARR